MNSSSLEGSCANLLRKGFYKLSSLMAAAALIASTASVSAQRPGSDKGGDYGDSRGDSPKQETPPSRPAPKPAPKPAPRPQPKQPTQPSQPPRAPQQPLQPPRQQPPAPQPRQPQAPQAPRPDAPRNNPSGNNRDHGRDNRGPDRKPSDPRDDNRDRRGAPPPPDSGRIPAPHQDRPFAHGRVNNDDRRDGPRTSDHFGDHRDHRFDGHRAPDNRVYREPRFVHSPRQHHPNIDRHWDHRNSVWLGFSWRAELYAPDAYLIYWTYPETSYTYDQFYTTSNAANNLTLDWLAWSYDVPSEQMQAAAAAAAYDVCAANGIRVRDNRDYTSLGIAAAAERLLQRDPAYLNCPQLSEDDKAVIRSVSGSDVLGLNIRGYRLGDLVGARVEERLGLATATPASPPPAVIVVPPPPPASIHIGVHID